VYVIGVAAVVIGLLGFILGFVGLARLDSWLWLDVWFLFFGGLAQGILLWAAVFRVAQARWTPAINRLGHSGLAFLPISYLVLIVLLTGVSYYVPWVAHPIPEKAAWLNVPLMVARDLLLVAVLGLLSFLLVRWSLAVDAGTARGEKVTEKQHYRLTAMGVAIVMTYSIVFTVISYDFIMSLSPDWISTMFAPYYWITNAYASLGVLILMAWLLRKPLGVERYIETSQFNDLGNLMLGFSLFSMGPFFAQYLTIWYGNLPQETQFLIIRYYRGPWSYLSWVSFLLAYAIPFVLLQSRALKHSPAALSVVSIIMLVGVALERYILVVPSVEPGKLGLAALPGLGGLAFFGSFILAVVAFLKRYPSVDTAEEALREIEPELEAIT
jgi:Ni/Fe-hydrogenase subunit HybB-like protein